MELVEVQIDAAAPERALETYAAICGVDLDSIGHDEEDVLVPVGEAQLRIGRATGPEGLRGIQLAANDLTARRADLEAYGLPIQLSEEVLELGDVHGIGVSLRRDTGQTVSGPTAAARLDHVALLVRDLAEASATWQAITGVKAEQMGLHPVSGGAFEAARVVLGGRMIELLTPVPGVPSHLADRLDSRGEGPVALALPVVDVAAAKARLAEVGARVIWQDPHWMVHPKDAAGVLVQLTPRVAH